MITDPITLGPDAPIRDAEALMAKYRICGVPVVEGHRLVGILTNRDLRFETRWDIPVREAMTKENLVTVPVGTTLEEAKGILQKHRIEKLLVVDAPGRAQGPHHRQGHREDDRIPQRLQGRPGRLRVAAAVGVGTDLLDRADALVEARWTSSAWTPPTATARACWRP